MSKETIYRCGWCGNATDQDGYPLVGEELEHAKALYKNHGDKIFEEIHGLCCNEEYQMTKAERLWDMITNR